MIINERSANNSSGKIIRFYSGVKFKTTRAKNSVPFSSSISGFGRWNVCRVINGTIAYPILNLVSAKNLTLTKIFTRSSTSKSFWNIHKCKKCTKYLKKIFCGICHLHSWVFPKRKSFYIVLKIFGNHTVLTQYTTIKIFVNTVCPAHQATTIDNFRV